MAHPLAVYLEENGLTQGEFAEKAGIERTVITKVLGGKRRRFSVEYAKKIAKATKNAVTIQDALGLSPRTAA